MQNKDLVTTASQRALPGEEEARKYESAIMTPGFSDPHPRLPGRRGAGEIIPVHIAYGLLCFGLSNQNPFMKIGYEYANRGVAHGKIVFVALDGDVVATSIALHTLSPSGLRYNFEELLIGMRDCLESFCSTLGIRSSLERLSMCDGCQRFTYIYHFKARQCFECMPENEEPEPLACPGYLYGISDGDFAIKIGFSTTRPTDRMHACQTGNRRRLMMVGAKWVKNCRQAERQAHAFFQMHRVGRSEWFILKPDVFLKYISELI